MDLNLREKVVLVAGGSRGIGLATARAFAAEGARVAIMGRGSESLVAAHDSLQDVAVSAEHLLTLKGDVTRQSELLDCLEVVETRFGPVDVAVANVGSGVSTGSNAIPRAEWQHMLEVNLLGSVSLSSNLLERMTARGAGSVVFVSSIAGVEAIGAPLAYAAAKSALLMVVKELARKIGPSGVRVNAVAPGNVLFKGGAWEQKLEDRREFFEDYIRKEVPMQRFATPEEIADVIVFLASSRASFVTGSTWVIDGGQTRSFL